MRNIFFILNEINRTACGNVLVQYKIWLRLFRSGHYAFGQFIGSPPPGVTLTTPVVTQTTPVVTQTTPAVTITASPSDPISSTGPINTEVIVALIGAFSTIVVGYFGYLAVKKK